MDTSRSRGQRIKTNVEDRGSSLSILKDRTIHTIQPSELTAAQWAKEAKDAERLLEIERNERAMIDNQLRKWVKAGMLSREEHTELVDRVQSVRTHMLAMS